jgi:hypothetical protein
MLAQRQVVSDEINAMRSVLMRGIKTCMTLCNALPIYDPQI